MSDQPRIRNPGHLFINGRWVAPESGSTINVIDPATEEAHLQVAEAGPADIDRAIIAAREAFDHGPWPWLSHSERAEYLRAIADQLEKRLDDAAALWPRETGILYRSAVTELQGIPDIYRFYATLAESYPFHEPAAPSGGGEWAALVREAVGVVGAIVPWNSPMILIAYKVAPALLAGCTVVLKASPEAPAQAYIMAEIAEAVGLPPGVVNMITADREVSERLVRDSRVDKITFTGSTAAGRRIAALCGERIARCTLELGGKSAALVLDDAPIADAAAVLAAAECNMAGQICSSLTRILVSHSRHDELLEAIAARFSNVVVGDPFDQRTQMGPLAMARQRDKVEQLVTAGVREGAVLAAGGRRPAGFDRGFFFEPTVFGRVDNNSTIAREEIFGPVLSVIPVRDETEAIEIANDSIYGLNASVFTPDPDRAARVARRLHSGTVGHNAFRTDFTIAAGGFKQSGLGREGGREGLRAYLEPKTIILNASPTREFCDLRD